MEIIKQSLESGEDVMISGFGKFQVKNKKERRGRNPATNEERKINKALGGDNAQVEKPK